MPSTPSQVGELTVSQTTLLKDSITTRLREIDAYADDSLTEYVLVLLANRHGPAKIMAELEDFLSPMVVEQFVNWLFKRYDEAKSTSGPANTAPSGLETNNPMVLGRQQRLFARALQDVTETRMETEEETTADVKSSLRHGERAPERIRSREARFGPTTRSRSPSPMARRHHHRSRSPLPRRARGRGRADGASSSGRSKSPRPIFYQSISSRREESRSYHADDRRSSILDRLGKVKDARQLLSSSRASSRGVFHVDDEVEHRPASGRDQRLSSSALTATSETKLVRCSYWPHCKAGDACEFAHPSEPCKHFPNCMFGDKCIYIHPVIPCKFQGRCQNPHCNYQHSSPAVASGKSFVIANNPFHPPSAIPCRFYPNCKNASCPFLHPNTTPCKFAENCQRPACPFFHPASRTLASKAFVNAPCRYGKSCSKPDCPFQHLQPSPMSFGEGVMTDKQNTMPDLTAASIE